MAGVAECTAINALSVLPTRHCLIRAGKSVHHPRAQHNASRERLDALIRDTELQDDAQPGLEAVFIAEAKTQVLSTESYGTL